MGGKCCSVPHRQAKKRREGGNHKTSRPQICDKLRMGLPAVRACRRRVVISRDVWLSHRISLLFACLAVSPCLTVV